MPCSRFLRPEHTMTTAIREVSAKSSMLSMSTAVTSANVSQLSLPRTTRSSMACTFVGAHDRSVPHTEPVSPNNNTPPRRNGKKSRVGATLRSAAVLIKKLCAPITSRTNSGNISTKKSKSKRATTSATASATVTAPAAQTTRGPSRTTKYPIYKKKSHGRGRSVAFVADTTVSAPVVSPSEMTADNEITEVSCFCALHGAVSTAFEHHPCCPLVNETSIATLATNWPGNTRTTVPPESIPLSSRQSTSATGLAERLRVWKPRAHRTHTRSHSQPFSQSHWRNIRFLTAYYNDPSGVKALSEDTIPTSVSTLRRGESLELPRTAELFYALPVKAQRQLFSPEERLVLTGRPDDIPLRKRPSQHRLDEHYHSQQQQQQQQQQQYHEIDSNPSEFFYYDHESDVDSIDAESFLSDSPPSCSSSIAASSYSVEETYQHHHHHHDDNDDTIMEQSTLTHLNQYRRNHTVVVNSPATPPSQSIAAALAFNRRETVAGVPLLSNPHSMSNLSDRHYHYNDSRMHRLLRRFRSRQRFDEMLWFGFSGEEEGEGRTLTVRVTLTPDMLQTM
ncbi:hypothetical protein BDF22DRAFT_739805 [Syncephalis plumigaleata]|nr:hypothetical protein BDF22DRAFT_739805 [Syncephalis plumigaleata]